MMVKYECAQKSQIVSVFLLELFPWGFTVHLGHQDAILVPELLHGINISKQTQVDGLSKTATRQAHRSITGKELLPGSLQTEDTVRSRT